MPEFIGSVDQGTTSTRFMVFDHGGNVIAAHQLEHEQILPQAGWVEHNPVEIWERTSSVIQTALGKAGLCSSDLAAMGITNQRETTVVWNKRTGRPYYNAIVWQDTRTDRIASALEAQARRDDPAQGRPAAGDLLLRRQDQVDPRERRRRARSGRTRRGAVRQHRQLVAVEVDRRQPRWRARHRRDQREPHDADEPGDPRLGRRTAEAVRDSAADAPRHRPVVLPGALRHDARGRAAGRPGAADRRAR